MNRPEVEVLRDVIEFLEFNFKDCSQEEIVEGVLDIFKCAECENLMDLLDDFPDLEYALRQK